MKTKIVSFIKTILSLLIIVLLLFLGYIIYNEIPKTNIADDVEEFVSNITTASGGTDKNTIQTPQVLEVQTGTITQEDTQIDYSTSTTNKYFYNQLNSYQKIIYNALEKNKENMKTGTYEINLGTEFSNVLSQENGLKILGDYYQTAVEAYTYDNPDVFYIDFQKLYLSTETTTRTTYKGVTKTYKVLINAGNNESYLKDGFTTESVDNALNKMERIKSYFIQNKSDNNYQNIKNIHDYLVESIDYDESISEENIYDIYGALINKKCVCEGYAKAFKYLLDGINIPCIVVSGEGTNSQGNTENHAWNYVELNGNWYAVDCTWDDPILVGGAILTNSIKYQYFLKGTEVFNKNHVPNGQFTEGGKIFEYPNLSASDY